MNNKTTKQTLEKIECLGKNIANQRKKLKYSQNKLAEMLDISREHLAKIETAKRCISLGLLIDIAEKLDIPVRDFFDF